MISFGMERGVNVELGGIEKTRAKRAISEHIPPTVHAHVHPFWEPLGIKSLA